jgi:hypothetical protein
LLQAVAVAEVAMPVLEAVQVVYLLLQIFKYL